MKTELFVKLKESLFAVLPITVIVLLASFIIEPMPKHNVAMFLISVLMLIVGMAFFTLGADISMMIMGEKIGSEVIRTRKLWWIILVTFIIGVIITVAEPDLKVLARQTPAVPDNVLIYSVALGVGIFLVVSFLRILLQLKLSYLLIGLYGVVFLIAAFTHKDFLAVAFDSGGVTTGPITVPFIMSLGVGLASVRGDNNAESDSFGLVALCSVGPILTVLLLGMFFNSSEGSYVPITVENYNTMGEIFHVFAEAAPEYMIEVAKAVAPIVVFFIIFQIFFLKLSKKVLIKIGIGLLYTYLGLVLFLTAANVGFMSVGYYIGDMLVSNNMAWLLIPLGMMMGYFIVAAEPAVQVLKQQVEDMTQGTISAKAMGLSLSIGVAISVGLAMVRVVTGISVFYMLIPGYVFALVMSFFVTPVFTAIAFDSGGVASGPMTATFLLPFAMGACESLGGNILTDAFGIVAMVAMTPLITIQALGLIYSIKGRRAGIVTEIITEDGLVDEIINVDEVIENE